MPGKKIDLGLHWKKTTGNIDNNVLLNFNNICIGHQDNILLS